jgi:hypothetical protein
MPTAHSREFECRAENKRVGAGLHRSKTATPFAFMQFVSSLPGKNFYCPRLPVTFVQPSGISCGGILHLTTLEWRGRAAFA